jgi:hypothetical protein
MRKSFAALAIASLVSGPAFAANTISESMSPGSMLVLSTGGQSMANFYVSALDFPSGTSLDQKTLTAIDWDTTYYPEATAEVVDLCFYEP